MRSLRLQSCLLPVSPGAYELGVTLTGPRRSTGCSGTNLTTRFSLCQKHGGPTDMTWATITEDDIAESLQLAVQFDRGRQGA
jgi:hypothetical protein